MEENRGRCPVNVIQVLPFGGVNASLLSDLCARISGEFSARCEILDARLDPAPAFNTKRQQSSSTQILASMQSFITPATWRLLGVTGMDLYIPILTFVFGEAQLDGACAVVSIHRLRQEFYGLPSDPKLLRERLLKEAVHELGHTLAMTHCQDYRCVMAPSHAVEWIDIKTSHFCDGCRARVLATAHSQGCRA